MNRRTLTLATIALTIIVLALSTIAWAMHRTSSLTIYDVFPLLGLSAFGLMWTHYVSGSLKRYVGLGEDDRALKRYFQITSYLVLLLILLHPGLLWYGLWSDGFGLPPLSAFAAYPDNAAKLALSFGTVSLLAFLLFETHRWFSTRRWWKYVEYLQIGAMALIFMHGLMLGGELMNSWFRIVWIVLGWILVMALVYNGTYDKRRSHGTTNSTQL